jgi:tetratricopeptide (TPR) repeat protein
METISPDRSASRRAVKTATGILLVFLLLAGCLKTPWDYHQADMHMNLGKAYIEANQYIPALKELLEAEKYTPSDPRIHFHLGIAYHGIGVDDKAVAALKKAVDLKPEYSEAHNMLGILYYNTRQWDMAIASFERALANLVYETPANALYNMGRAYHQKGDYPQAMSRYQEALRRAPNTVLGPIIFKDMGVTSLAMGRVDEATLHLKRALADVPDYAEAQYWLAECSARKKDRAEAIRQFQALAERAPESEFGVKAQGRLNDLKQTRD